MGSVYGICTDYKNMWLKCLGDLKPKTSGVRPRCFLTIHNKTGRTLLSLLHEKNHPFQQGYTHSWVTDPPARPWSATGVSAPVSPSDGMQWAAALSRSFASSISISLIPVKTVASRMPVPHLQPLKVRTSNSQALLVLTVLLLHFLSLLSEQTTFRCCRKH